MPSGTVESASPLRVIAEGLLYSVDVETTTADVDWLDKVIQAATQQPRKVEEVLAAFPLPRRFMENALARLLERNLMLLNVYDGTVRASPLRQVSAGRSSDTFLVWQDHATGMLVPFERVSQLEVAPRELEGSGNSIVRITGGPPRRTPLEMSDAELLHHLRRYKLHIDPRAEVSAKHRVRRSTLSIRGMHLEDGRLVLKDTLPWPLRMSWARLPTWKVPTEPEQGDLSLPPRWEEVVGRWAHEVRERLLRRKQLQQSLLPMIHILAADLSVITSMDAPAAAKRISREARSSVVVAVSGRFGTAGDGIQLLKEANVARRILVTTTPPNAAKRQLWEGEGIDVIVTGKPEGADFLLADGQILVFGGISSASARAIVVQSQSPLEGYNAWLNELGVTIPREERTSAADIIADLQAFEYEIGDLQGEAATVLGREDAVNDLDSNALERIRMYLNERCGSIEGRLVQRNPSPFSWLSPAEVLGIVQHWPGSLRVLLRSATSRLAQIALARDVEVATWPTGDVAADCVILEKVVLLGVSVNDDNSFVPDFLAIANADLASELRIATARLTRIVQRPTED